MASARWIEPQFSKLATSAPSGPQWVHEIKFDSYRMAARIEKDHVKLLTRSGLDRQICSDSGSLRRAVEANRNYPDAYFHLAPALAQLGRVDEACSAVKAGLALNPAYTISHARAARTARSDDPTYLAQLEPIFEGMRKAGLPE